ncbi:hypothetical protein KP509_11G019500 [Ceratopteris richardii]|uniref:Uncharacterized protein n=1 Tax=Ceratopteris richardii TaxID=49495 RepID=A0A8T2TQG4_CERRI|nr:hypothetical protein KP509_11G019500 [Ceratopteris richardii]KAH7424689.1 hypothetical protein KP509_11G019500 [Ceratopteris richardii]
MEDVSSEAYEVIGITPREDNDRSFEHTDRDRAEEETRPDEEDDTDEEVDADEGEDRNEKLEVVSLEACSEDEKADPALESFPDSTHEKEISEPQERYVSDEGTPFSEGRASRPRTDTQLCSITGPSAILSPCPRSPMHTDKGQHETLTNDLRLEVCTILDDSAKYPLSRSPIEPATLLEDAAKDKDKHNLDLKSPKHENLEKNSFKKELLRNSEDTDKENLMAEVPAPHAVNKGRGDHFKGSPRALRGQPHLPVTEQKPVHFSAVNSTPPRKNVKIKKEFQAKLILSDCLKTVYEASRPTMPKNLKQRQQILPLNCLSKRRLNSDANDNKLDSPSSRLTDDHEDDDDHQNRSRASIESSPCIRQQGCNCFDDMSRLSSLHMTTRSTSRMEKMSLRGGKIDRVARFAQLQKIWKKDSFLRGIDGEKRPQIMSHLFAPNRGI